MPLFTVPGKPNSFILNISCAHYYTNCYSADISLSLSENFVLELFIKFEIMLALGLLLLSVVILSLIWVKRRHILLARGFPGPPTLPLLGNSLLFAGIDHNEIIQTAHKLHDQYGSPMRFWLGPHLVIGVADPQNMEIIMKSTENLNKSMAHRFFADFIDGVFLATGKRWRKLRKIINSMFHANSMEAHIVMFNRMSNLMCDILEDKVGEGIFDIRTNVNNCVLDIICQTAMRTPMNVQGKDKGITYPDDISHVSEIVMQRGTKVWLYSNIIFNWTKLGRSRTLLVKRILKFVKSVMNTREIIRKYDGLEDEKTPYSKSVTPFIDMMFDYANQQKLSENKLAVEINDLMVAGSDTSAVATSYALLMLGMDQKLQDKVYTELKEIFGDSGRPATMEDLALMTQLEMVVKETVRITCPPHMARTVETDIQLGDNNQVVPSGATLYMLLYSLHRNPLYWSHPDEFYPDHFLPEVEEARPKYSYLPFSYGLRICPGHKYGTHSMKTIISTVLRRFKVISELKKEDLKYKVSIMLELANGYPVRLEKRV